MPYEYQMGEDVPGLGAQGEVLPDELSNRYFQALDKALARSEAAQMERVQGTLADQGFFRSGENLKQVSEQVLGPAQERRAQIILPEMQRAAGQAREERLGGVAFERQKELSKQESLQRLDELDKQAQIKRMLLELESSLSEPTGDIFSGILGSAAGSFAGAFGGKAGGKAGSALFGGK